ncbi:MATE family efflux transporter [Candidatus Omnitrophota bacterium]
MSFKKQIVKNIMSNYMLNFIGMFLGFLLIPFLVKKLGQEAFGLTVLAESTIIFFEIATISVRIALSRHATFALAQKKMDDFIEYLSTGRFILFFSTILVFIGGSLLSYYFPVVFKVPAVYSAQSKILFFLITVAFSISVLAIVFWSVLYAKQRYDLINISSSIGRIVRAALIFILFSLLPPKFISLSTYGFVFLAMICMENFMVYWWCKRVMPGIQISMMRFKKEKVKDILSFSAHTSVTRISFLLYHNTANILINLFWGAGFNAIYGISLKIPLIMERLFLATSWTLAPTFTDLVAKNDRRRFKMLFFMYTKLITVITAPILLLIVCMAQPIISLWVGDEMNLAGKVLLIHIVPLFVTVPFAVCGCITTAYAKVKIPSRVNLGSAILNIALILFLTKFFNLQLFGIAIASSSSRFLASALFASYYACKVSNISLKKYLIGSFVAPFLWVGLIMGGCFAIIYSLQSNFSFSLISILLLSVFTVICYGGAYKIVLSEEERYHIRDIIGAFLKGFYSSKIQKIKSIGNPVGSR